MDEEKIINERKKNLIEFMNKKSLWVVLILAVLVIFGVYLRSLPMQDHGGKPGLWDITTNTWTLGPDLDPFLFLRYAKTMVSPQGLPHIDTMRNVPLGFDNSKELQMVSYMIVGTYKVVNLFGSYNMDFAGVLMPVIFFGLIIIAFFLFVREIFARKKTNNSRANIIAIISTVFMILIPVFISRTIAGIPEKESVGFFFMFLAFYLFLKAWKCERIRNAIIIGGLAGISTALMGLTWGGVVYIYVTVAVASFAAFFINKINKKEFLIYTAWLVISWGLTLMMTNRFSLKEMITSLDTGLAFLVFIVLGVHFLVWNTSISRIKIIRESKIPRNIISLIIAIVVGILLVSVIFGPSFLINKIKDFNQIMFKPVTGRWSTTVAENRQPYFSEWAGSFGPLLRNVPLLFWMFFIGSVVLFRKMIGKVDRKHAWMITGGYILFFFGLVFSRYSSSSVLNGENLVSKTFYYGSALLFLGLVGYYYFRYGKTGRKEFESIEFEYIFLFALFVLAIFTARSAVRLIMVLGPIAPIMASYLAVESVDKFRKSKEETRRILAGVGMVFVLVISLYCMWSYYKETKATSENYIPSAYTQQWQKAMSWVRNETPTNAVFAHWWDYGYWVQSIGNRATVTDGGNAIVWWNYLTGRYVLTGDNQKGALEFLYSHNASYLLIDSSDLQKYGAFSSIGSDKNFDRYSSGPPTLISGSADIKETKDMIARQYSISAGDGKIALMPLEEDISYNDNGTQLSLLKGNSALAYIDVGFTQTNGTLGFKKASGVFITNGNKMVSVPLRYVYYNYTLFDFKQGLDATAYVIPRVSSSSVDPTGAVMYISPRVQRGLLGQIYILNNALGNFNNFILAHSEPNFIVSSIEKQGFKLNEFSYVDGYGTVGPIKIWNVKYTGSEKINPDYLRTSPPDYIDWEF